MTTTIFEIFCSELVTLIVRTKNKNDDLNDIIFKLFDLWILFDDH